MSQWYIIEPNSAHVTLPCCGCRLRHHTQAVPDFGKCCTLNQERCIWRSKQKIGEIYWKRKADGPLVVQREIGDLEPANECPDVYVAPVDDCAYAQESWPACIRVPATAHCRWKHASETDR